MSTRFVVAVCCLVLLAACASNPERMADSREPAARDRADCLLSRGVIEAGAPIEKPPSWCRDDKDVITWSSDGKDKDDMEVDFKRKRGDDSDDD